ncbi:hypothetical protein [Alkalicoccobacillus gibsonii]|uniref:hypothetical protein n=1 Tax=Alkalicoccobacillus gibsonii TaxID=79881 RepID=UPI0019312577|nr:hypothetical protein [Alkalicoccobacillus gibsonii]MBM0064918.1 hypothetical protein [Alkalicoccobacillus gibsonii]
MSNQPSLDLGVIIELLNQKGLSTETEEGDRLPFLIDAEHVGLALAAVLFDSEELGAALASVMVDSNAVGEALSFMMIQAEEDRQLIKNLEEKIADLEAQIGGEMNE